MSDAADPGELPEAPVCVRTQCRGPVGGECSRVLAATVPHFQSREHVQGVRCAECGRVNHVDWTAISGGASS